MSPLDTNEIVLLTNSIVTLVCGLVLFFLIYIKKIEKHFIYYFWGLGFVLYSLRLFSNFFLGYENTIIELALGLPTYLFFVIGTWGITGKKWVLYLLSVLVMPLIITWLMNLPILDVYIVFFYGLLTVGVVVNRNLLGRSMDKLVIGWVLLLLANLILGTSGWLSDSFATVAKIILLFGIIDGDLALRIMRARMELSSHDYPINVGNPTSKGGIRIIIPRASGESPVKSISKWINLRLEENIKNGVETNLLIMQNIIPYGVLRSFAWKKQESVHIFVFSENKPKNAEFSTFGFDLIEIGAVLTEIVRKNSADNVCGETFMVDLSILIHTFGAKPVYDFLLNKMGDLRSSGTPLFAFLNAETHEKREETLFKSISDEIIRI